jgi:hypothetical protein
MRNLHGPVLLSLASAFCLIVGLCAGRLLRPIGQVFLASLLIVLTFSIVPFFPPLCTVCGFAVFVVLFLLFWELEIARREVLTAATGETGVAKLKRCKTRRMKKVGGVDQIEARICRSLVATFRSLLGVLAALSGPSAISFLALFLYPVALKSTWNAAGLRVEANRVFMVYFSTGSFLPTFGEHCGNALQYSTYAMWAFLIIFWVHGWMLCSAARKGKSLPARELLFPFH